MTILRDAIQDLPRETIVWLDLFNVNQFVWRSDAPAAKAKKTDFQESLANAIASIRSTHLLVEGWTETHDTTRKIWVVWEIFLTLKVREHDTIFTGEQMFHAIAQTPVLEADTSNQQDRIGILEKIGQYSANQVVKRGLCEWYGTW